MKKLFIAFYLTISASFTPIAAKYVVNEITPIILSFLRFGLATLLLLIIFFIRKQKLKIEKKDVILFLFLGALVIPINQFFFLYGVYFSEASHAGVFYACIPLVVYLFSIILKIELFSFKKLLTISLSVIGLIIIFWENITESNTDNSNKLLGDVFLFFAISSWALYLTLSKNMVSKYGTTKTTTIAFSLGMILSIPLFFFDMHNFSLQKLTLWGVVGFFHLSVVVAFAGKYIYTYSTKIITISTLATFTNIAPIITILLSWILLKEELSYFFIFGALITLFGVYLTQFFIDRNIITK
jgi:drug/metabolite transporter (DMT)-like permease